MKLPRLCSNLPELISQLTVVIKDLETVELWISVIEVLVIVHRQAGMGGGISQPDLHPKMCPEVEDLHSIIPRIEDHHLVPRSGNLGWILKFPRSRPTAALAPAGKDMTLLIEHDDHMAGCVTNIDMARRCIDSYPPGNVEVRLPPSGACQLVGKLALRVADQDGSPVAVRHIDLAISVGGDTDLGTDLS